LLGFLSLFERKLFALCHLRVGPNYIFLGLLTPIFDGIKLFLKFCCFIFYLDLFFFSFIFFCFYFSINVVWFIIPFGLFVCLDFSFSFLICLCCHCIFNFCGLFFIGFILISCFVYLSLLRLLFFGLILEFVFVISLYIFFVCDFFSFFCYKCLFIMQFLFFMNVFFVSFLFCFLFYFLLLFDSYRLPFDYLECESELVAGFVTEFSGWFFVLFSLCEYQHLLFVGFIFIILNFGGLFICFKFFFFVVFGLLFPRVIFCRLRLNHSYYFISFYFIIFCTFFLGFMFFFLFF
jgi:NADH-quinone oxidoreductase subunit H